MRTHLKPNQIVSHGNSLISTSLLIFTPNYTFQTRRNRALVLFCLNDNHCLSNHNVPNTALSILSINLFHWPTFRKVKFILRGKEGQFNTNMATKWFNKDYKLYCTINL